MSSVNCQERAPYGSLIALTLVSMGSGMMCGSNFEAIRRVGTIFEDRFYPVNEIKPLKIVGIAYCVVTMLLAIVNLMFGALATGTTRHSFYSTKQSTKHGRSVFRWLLFLTYFATLAWLVLFVLFAVPVGLWIMLHRVCAEETEYWRSISADKDETQFSYTFNLTRYGLYRRPLDLSLYSEHINSPSAFTQLCQELSSVGPLFTIALCSTFTVLLGLVCFVACLSGTVVRLKYSIELEQYRSLVSGSGGRDDMYGMQPLLGSNRQLGYTTAGTMHPNTFSGSGLYDPGLMQASSTPICAEQHAYLTQRHQHPS